MTTSPEITSKNTLNRGIAYRALHYFFIKPFISPIRNKILLMKWAIHADDRALDWDWSRINFNRMAVISILTNKLKDPHYLEIGCSSDILFNSVPTINKVGVDPSSGGNVRLTSDEFFADNKQEFDVIFIDGLHTYDQVRRDLINSFGALKDGGWIAIHDMLPRNWTEHHLPIVSTGAWTGDVWKVAFELLATDGIEFKLLKLDHGVGVIKVLRKNIQLKDFREELWDKEFSWYYDNLSRLPIVEWREAQIWLKS
jgi:hypothetical protein